MRGKIKTPKFNKDKIKTLQTIYMISDTNKIIEKEMDEAKRKAYEALSRYKFNMFGYWAAIWVHLNRISKLNKPNPFRILVKFSRAFLKRENHDISL